MRQKRIAAGHAGPLFDYTNVFHNHPQKVLNQKR
jgi:hypothetical protein